MTTIYGDQNQLLARRRRKRIMILEIFTVIAGLASSEVYFDFPGTLASICYHMGLPHAADVIYGQALFVQEGVRGSNSPALIDLLNDMAYFYWDTEQNAKANRAVERSLAICQSNFGPTDPRCAWTLSVKSLVFDGIGNFPEAERMARQALPILETAYGRQSYAVASTLNRLGLALEGEGRFPEAEATLLQALAIREDLYGHDSFSLIPILQNLARVYDEQGKEEAASSMRRRVNDITAHRSSRR